MNFFNTELQSKETESAIKNKLVGFFSELGGCKFVKTLVLEFKKITNDDETMYSTFYLNSEAETIIKESDTGDLF